MIIYLDIDPSAFRRNMPSQIIEKARRKEPNHYNRLALEAFEAGKNFFPPTFEYGLGAGNYQTDLVSENGRLYYVARRRNYRQKLIPIMLNEEAERYFLMTQKEVA